MRLVIAACLALSFASVTFALSPYENKFEETLVIGTRTPQTLEGSLAPVTLITRDDIEKLQSTDMTSLLSRIPSVHIANSGTPLSSPKLSLRGTKNGQTLILLNGERMNSTSTGDSAFQFIDPEQVERIEVIRGARASLYGADAVGGVINIITRSGKGDDKVYASAGYGTYNTQRYSLGSRFNAGNNNQFYINLFNNKSDGFDSTLSKIGETKDDDPYENTGINLAYERKLHKGAFSLNYLQNRGENDYDDGINYHYRPYHKAFLDNLSAMLDLSPNDIWHSALQVSQLRDYGKEDGHLGLQEQDKYNTKRQGATWQNDFYWQNQSITTLGVDFYKDELESTRNYAFNTIDNTGIFLQHQTQIDWFELQAAVRYDDNNRYGENTTGNLTLGANLGNNAYYLTYATAFRAPTLNDLYLQIGNYRPYGNPSINPEKSRQFEVGLTGGLDQIFWQASAYYNKINDLISSCQYPDSPDFHACNINKAEIQGFEVVLGYQFTDLSISANYGFVDARDLEDDSQLPYTPRNLFNLDIIKNLGRDFDVGMTLLARSKSFANDGTKLGGYATVDAFVAYKVINNLTAKLKFSNLLDKDYYVNGNYGNLYNTSGIAAFFSLNYDYTL